MTFRRTKLLASAARVTLHSAVATFATPAESASVIAWRDKDGFGSPYAMITIHNSGAASVSLASPTLQVSDGTRVVDMGLLFATTPIVIPAGEKVIVAAPQNALAVGHLWRLTGTPTSGATVSLTVTADCLQSDE